MLPNFQEVETQTTPKAIPIKVAADIAGRSEPYLFNECMAGRLNFSFAFVTRYTDAGGNEQLYYGQRLILEDEKWEQWLRRKNQTLVKL